MKRLAVSLLSLGGLLLLGGPAQAISCKQWQRMGPQQKAATVERMIASTVRGSKGRQYRVDRGAVGRCLNGQVRNIEYDFDGACADPRTAGMHELNRIFKDYLWSCAG